MHAYLEKIVYSQYVELPLQTIMSRTRLVFMLQTCKFLVKGYYELTARIDKQKTLYKIVNTWNDVEDSTRNENFKHPQFITTIIFHALYLFVHSSNICNFIYLP